jgi:hypothetical protein
MKIAKDAKDEEAKAITSWLCDGVYDALRRKFVFAVSLILTDKLHAIVFGIYLNEEKPDELLEAYFCTHCICRLTQIVSVDYNSETVMVEKEEASHGKLERTTLFKGRTKDQVKSTATSLVRSLVSLVGTLGPIPKDRYLMMRCGARLDDPQPTESLQFTHDPDCSSTTALPATTTLRTSGMQFKAVNFKLTRVNSQKMMSTSSKTHLRSIFHSAEFARGITICVLT